MNKKMKYRLFLLCFVATSSPFFSFAQLKEYNFEEIDSLQQLDKKRIVVFLNTDWCTYCQMMKSTTFKNDKVANALNKNFYFIDFNAENKRDVIFRGAIFKYKTTSGIHQLAEQLGTVNGKVAYPTICFLNENFEIVYQHNEALTAKEFLKLLAAFKAK
jgi:thioredoxin-related protein